MASPREGQQQTFPTVPPSPSAGDHETRDYYAPQHESRPTFNQAPYLTPYLGLRARLSQIWFNRWTILLFLVLVRTLIAIANIDDNIDSARRQALSACSGVEAAGSAMASMPHYMSRGVNELTASGIERAVNGLMSMLELTVTGVQEMVVFVINLLTSTYMCLITLAVTSNIRSALALLDDLSGFLNETLGSIGDNLSEAATGFTADLNSFVDKLNSIPFLDNEVPTLNIGGDIDKLRTLKIPTEFTDNLAKLNSSIPDFQDVKNFTDGLIRAPFQEVKRLINESMHDFVFDRSVFPVPERSRLSFCTGSDGINSFFDNLVDLEVLARKIFLAVIIILAIAVCVPMAWWEIRRWRTMQLRSALVQNKSFDPLDVVYLVSRPHSSSFGIKIANKLRSVRQQTAVRWAVAYATSPPALFILALGVAGLFACLCQYILLQAIKKEAPELTNQVSQFAEKVVTSLNNASQQWADGTNGAIIKTNNDINQNIFGWVNTSTTAVNDTLNSFVDGMNEELTNVFGGTILEQPVRDIIGCLITLKIVGIQKGLTWVKDNAHIDFPLLANDTFSLGALASISNDTSDDSFLASPGSSSKDDITAAVDRLTRSFESAIRTEAIISICIILVWVLAALIGIGRVIMVLSKPGKLRGEGGHTYFVDSTAANGQTQAGSAVVVQRESMAPTYEYAMTRKDEAPSYTITPRPFPSFHNNEKVGDVGAHNPGVVEPTHMRSSSYGHVGGLTPIDEKSSNSHPFPDYRRH